MEQLMNKLMNEGVERAKEKASTIALLRELIPNPEKVLIER